MRNVPSAHGANQNRVVKIEVMHCDLAALDGCIEVFRLGKQVMGVKLRVVLVIAKTLTRILRVTGLCY
jgi:hypothetical protein